MRPVYFLGLTLVAWAGLCGRLQAEEEFSPIDDQAHLFTKAGIEEATKQIRAIKESPKGYGLDLYIMTIDRMPPEEEKKFPFWKRLQRETFFYEWALSKAEEVEISGLFVLICKSPSVIKVVAYPREREEYFTYRDRDELRKVYINKVSSQGGEPNGALLAMIDLFKHVLEAKGPPGKAVRPPWQFILIFIAGLLGLWVVLFMLNQSGVLGRGAISPRAPDQLPALLGGMFGTLPAAWIYDRLLRRPTPAGGVSSASGTNAPSS